MIQEIILETKDLAKHFGGLKAVDGVNVQVRAGSLHAIIGPNGAGKTTLFNLISGHLKPTRGQVLLRGQDITGLPPHRLAHMGIGRSFQITNIFPNLTVLENVRLAVQARGPDNFKLWRDYRDLSYTVSQAQSVIDYVSLKGKEHLSASALSHGDKRKLELAILLAGDPDVLLLDEPTAGMASEDVPELMRIIEHIRQTTRKTILLVEHNMDVVMRISERITVMHRGRVLAEGIPDDVAANEVVQSAYLGTWGAKVE